MVDGHVPEASSGVSLKKWRKLIPEDRRKLRGLREADASAEPLSHCREVPPPLQSGQSLSDLLWRAELGLGRVWRRLEDRPPDAGVGKVGSGVGQLERLEVATDGA